jgi:hypothetical protein
MTLKEWLKPMDLVFEVSIWGSDEEPLFEGPAFNIPWTIVDYKIGRIDKQDKREEPIYIAVNNVHLPKIVINVIDKEEGGSTF